MIDSGSNRSFLGQPGIDLVSSLGIPIRSIQTALVNSAFGQLAVVNEMVDLPISLKGNIRNFKVRLLPALHLQSVFGTDFLHCFGLVTDFVNYSWHFASNPENSFRFELDYPSRCSAANCHALVPLTDKQSASLTSFIERDIPPIPDYLPATNLIEHKIEVGNNPPIKQRYRLTAPKVHDAIVETVKEYLRNDIVEPSTSDWSSPIVMVRKPNGTYRLCMDFRKLNAVTKKDAYPLAYMNGILDKLRCARFISTIDLSQAYHQVPLNKKSREYTAFTVPGLGLLQFKRMPYGLTNAPATFQRLLDRIITPDMEPYAFAYLDDIIIATETFEEHLHWLDKVLHKLREANLTINRDKCEFCRSQVKYLGFLVNSEGLRVDPDKVSPILQFPAPVNVSKVRQFLGLASWYRRFIPDFATIAAPLTLLLRKNQPWVWGEEQQSAFEKIRFLLATNPVLARPDYSKEFQLQTDASSTGLGAVLSQNIDGVERVIAYASRSLTPAERNYTATERECLAVVWSIQKFRCYIEGSHFRVITDHSSLRWLSNLKDPAGRLGRWALALQGYQYTIEHRKGASHHVPDALSRMYEGDRDMVAAMQDATDLWYCERFDSVRKFPARFPAWKIENSKLFYHRPNPVLDAIIEDLDAWKLVLPKDLRERALYEKHNEPQAGHLGVDKTYARLATEYYWRGMFRDVVKYVKTCPECQKGKVEQLAPSGLMGRRIVEEPWTVVAADILGPFPRTSSGFKYILVMQDLFTKWVEFCPLRKATGPKIRNAFEELILMRWGTPQVMVTDNGTEFVNSALRELAREYNIYHSCTPPYHAQSNPAERVNRVLKTMVVIFIKHDHRTWDHHLTEFRFAYNTALHTSIRTTPAFLNFGRNPRAVNTLRGQQAPFLSDPGKLETQDPTVWSDRMERLAVLRDWVTENLEEAYKRQAKYYNTRRREHTFAVDDLVLIKTRTQSSAEKNISSKLAKKFHGPFRLTKQLSPVVFEVSDLKGTIMCKLHVQDIKRYLA